MKTRKNIKEVVNLEIGYLIGKYWFHLKYKIGLPEKSFL